jgi:hypothetical protein
MRKASALKVLAFFSIAVQEVCGGKHNGTYLWGKKIKEEPE